MSEKFCQIQLLFLALPHILLQILMVFCGRLTVSNMGQLASPLVKGAVPVDTLLEQHRMAPLLRELPSQRCYVDKL